jgi:hypothetical protein
MKRNNNKREVDNMKKLLTKQLALATLFCFLIAQCAMAVSFNAPMGNIAKTTGAQRILGLYNHTQTNRYATVQAMTPQMDAWYKTKLAERDRKKAWKQNKIVVLYKRTPPTPLLHIGSAIPAMTVPVNSTAMQVNSTTVPTA